MKFTPENINSLCENEIFVFGSNNNGHHCSGAAHIAIERFGAIWGKGVGIQGHSYAIPTMEGDIDVLYAYVCDFLEFAKLHPTLTFLVTRIGCGIAGYKDAQIAPLFRNALKLKNVVLPKSFVDILLPLQQKVSLDKNPYFGMKYNMDMVLNLVCQRNLALQDFVFFWKDYDNKLFVTKKCLSQWYHAPFVIDNHWYNCVEQYMMAEKARLFDDDEIRHLILKLSDQMTIKRLGRMVRNFKDEVWMTHRCEIIKRGNVAKFCQNSSLKEYLLSTEDKILAEASPNDVIYGIGMEEHVSEIIEPSKWRGLNLLGFTLMEVRDIIGEKMF